MVDEPPPAQSAAIDAELADICAEFNTLGALKEETTDSLLEKLENYRFRLAFPVIVGFMWIVLAAILLLFGLSILILLGVSGTGNDETPEDLIGEISAVFTSFVASVLLPVVTLVVGYYFGTEKNNGRNGDSLNSPPAPAR